MLIRYLKTNHRASLAGAISLLCSIAMTNAPAQSQVLATKHTRDAVMGGQAAFVQHLNPAQTLHLVIGLPLNNRAELDSFLENLYNPGSPNFRQYLSGEQFTEMFGPTQADYDAVVRFAQRNNFVVSGIAPNRLILEVDASVSNIEKAFNVTMNVYQHPTENRTFYAPDREPTMNLSTKVWNINGLDNFSIPRPSNLSQKPRSGYCQHRLRTGRLFPWERSPQKSLLWNHGDADRCWTKHRPVGVCWLRPRRLHHLLQHLWPTAHDDGCASVNGRNTSYLHDLQRC